MIELVNKRTANSKTFLLENGRRRKKVYGGPVHFMRKGNWEEINTLGVESASGYKFKNLPYEVTVPKDVVGDNLVLRGEGYSLKMNLVPYKTANTARVKGNKLRASGDKAEFVLTAADVMGSADLRHIVSRDGIVKTEFRMESVDDVPDHIMLEVWYEGLAFEEVCDFRRHRTDAVGVFEDAEVVDPDSGIVKTKRRQVGEEETNTEELSPLPSEIKFVQRGEAEWTIKAPVYFDANGKECRVPLKILREELGYMLIEIEVPKGWLFHGVVGEYDVMFPVVLDPVYQSSLVDIQNGDTMTYEIPEDVTEILEAKCRWQGRERVRVETQERQVTDYAPASSTTGTLLEASSTIPNVPAGGTLYRYFWQTSGSWQSIPARFWEEIDFEEGLQVRVLCQAIGPMILLDMINHSPPRRTPRTSMSASVSDYSTIPEPGVDAGGVEVDHKVVRAYDDKAFAPVGGDAGELHIAPYASYSRTIYTRRVTVRDQTENVSVTVNGLAASHAGTIGNDEFSPWISMPLEMGTNIFKHSVGGSRRARWEFYYDYKTGTRLPVWDGEEWLEGEVKVWDGEEWLTPPLRLWGGEGWREL